MTMATQIDEAAEAYKAEVDAHPECNRDLRDQAALAGVLHPHAVFSVGRFPDIDQGEGKPPPRPPPQTPEQRLLSFFQGAGDAVEMLQPVDVARGLGRGPGTMAAPFGIRLNPDLGFTPQGNRALGEVLREGLPDPETSGLFPEMRDDIEVTRALAPDWVKLALPDMQGPFNIAHMVLGDDAFLAPLTQPAEWKAFMQLVTEFFIAAHRTLTRWIGPQRLHTDPSRYHRITECSVNMVSKEFYLEHILEHDSHVADQFGDIAIHPCSGPHVFHVTLEHLPVVYTEAGSMINPMSAGSISVEEALAAIGDRPIMLSIGEELPAGAEEATIRHIFDLIATNPRAIAGGFTGLGWKKGDEPRMRELHRRMNEYYASLVEG